jgi:hypothetical protein
MAKPLILLQRRSLIKNQKHGFQIHQFAAVRKVSVIAGSRLANLRRVQIRDPLAGAHKEGSQALSEVRKNADAANALEHILVHIRARYRAPFGELAL